MDTPYSLYIIILFLLQASPDWESLQWLTHYSSQNFTMLGTLDLH